MKSRSVLIRIRHALLGMVAFLVILYSMVCAWIIYCGRDQVAVHADAAIILGAAAWGEKPSPVFSERIRYAVSLYHRKVVNQLIFTGGTPKPGFPTEAKVGALWAMQNGVPKKDILLDNTSRNTLENLHNAAVIGCQHHLNTFVLISDPYHMARASLMAQDLGMAIYNSPTPSSRFNHASWSTRGKFLLQESNDFIAYSLIRLPGKWFKPATGCLEREEDGHKQKTPK